MAQEPDAFSTMTARELVSSVAHERGASDRIARACIELHDRFGWTWQQIGEAIDVPYQTVHRWVQDYQKKRQPE